MVTYQEFFSGVGVSLRLSLLHYFFCSSGCQCMRGDITHVKKHFSKRLTYFISNESDNEKWIQSRAQFLRKCYLENSSPLNLKEANYFI